MARMKDRIARAEGRVAPPAPETSPEQALSTSLLLKAQDAARRELDGQPPDPANELTPEERAYEADEGRAREWIAYLEGELARAPPGNPMHDTIGDALAAAKADLEDPKRGAP